MFNKRLIWSSISLVLVVSFVLTACATPTAAPAQPTAAPVQPTAAPAQPTTAPEPVTLRYALWQANQLAPYQMCADAFTAKNPGIKIEISQTNWPDYWPALQTGFASGTAPDVFTDHLAYYPTFSGKGQLVDIQPLVEKDNVDLSVYLPGLADLWVRDGKRYGLPKDWDTIALVYNKDMLAKAGVTEKELNEATWNPTDGGTFEQIMAKLTLDKNGKSALDPAFDAKNIVQYGFTNFSDTGNGGAYGQQQWSYLSAANGFKFNDKLYDTKYYYDDPKLAEAIDWVSRMMNKTHYAVPYTDIKSLGGSSLFQAGKVAMISDGSWMIDFYAQSTFKTGFARLPLGPAGRKSMFNGLTDGIWVGSKHQAEAWEWVKYLASPECANTVGEAGVVFPAQESAVNKALAADTAKGLDVSAFTLQATEKDGTFLFPLTDHAPEINPIMTETLDAIFLGTVDAKSALAEASTKVNALFK